MKKVKVADWKSLADRQPAHSIVANVDLVVIKLDAEVSVMYGRCLHRGALLADGFVEGKNLVCGLHSWDYQCDTGVSSYNNKERLYKFSAWIEDGVVLVDEDEIGDWEKENPQPYDREAYQGNFQDIHGTPEEPATGVIHSLAANGVPEGSHGPIAAMGIPAPELPSWDAIQFVTAQLATLPHLEDVPVGSEVIVGPSAKKPLRLEMPIFVSDMSFGALSEEAKIALARGAELAGTGICSGEGGMLAEEQAENDRYFYELASARFGFSMDKLKKVQAFHFKGGQGAKTGTGGHLPGAKVQGKIAKTRGLEEGTPAVSPPRFPDWTELSQFRDFAEEVREISGGIPIGYKLSAQHIEDDIDAVLEVGVDYIILDGRGGGTGAAPTIFRDNISVPTIPALARARKHLDATDRNISLFITGGLRTPADFAKALALGADGIAISNSAMQAIGCIAMRACHTNNCPVGIATQKKHLRDRLDIQVSAERLARFFTGSVHMMKLLARACGHDHLNQFNINDLTTWDREMAALSGVAYGGVAGN